MQDNITYNSWPIGKLPKEFQRPELDQVKALGYDWKDPRDVVKIFEEKVAKFAGAKYGVAVDCCSHALFLSIMCEAHKDNYSGYSITIPKRTYVSVPMQIMQAGYYPIFEDLEWEGAYKLKPFPIWDAAVRWKEGMYLGGFHCVSFQIKKRIPIGRGGMILLDNKDDYDMLCRLRYDGRNLDGDYMADDYKYGVGYHMYMTPEDAARGIILMDQVPKYNEDSGGSNNYSDLSLLEMFK